MAVAAILRDARDYAAQHWHPTRCDVYACVSHAWRGAGMPVAYVAVVAVLRSLLPAGVRLIELNDRAADSGEICDFLDRALGVHPVRRGVA